MNTVEIDVVTYRVEWDVYPGATSTGLQARHFTNRYEAIAYIARALDAGAQTVSIRRDEVRLA